MTAFDHAWTLLKQRGHEIYRPEMEQDEIKNLQDLIDARVDETDRRKLLVQELGRHLSIPGYSKDFYSRDEHTDNLLNAIRESNLFADDYDRDIDVASQNVGPMVDLQRQRAAEDIEAEGIELPDVPSSAPPANIGMAGSLTPAPFRPDLEQLRQSMTPLGQALAKVRAGSGPQPLQFDQ